MSAPRHDQVVVDAPTTTTPDNSEVAARAAIRSGVLAYFVDQYDIYLPIIALAPATIYFQSADLSKGSTAILSALVFVATLLGRPIGSAIFGHYADTTGRKKATLIAVAGFGITTLLIALLPGHQTIGAASIGLLIALRFIDGIFLGGEYTTAVPLAMEWSPKSKRGWYSSLITSTSPGAYAVIAAITLLLLTIVPAGALDSPYVQWGWRIPFAIGAVLAAVLFRAYLREVEEPPTERTSTDAASPLVTLFSGAYRRSLMQVFVLMTGTWLATNMGLAVLPGLLKSHLEMTSKATTIALMIATAVCVPVYFLCGILSQRIGRRPFYLGYGLVVAIVGSTSFAITMSKPHGTLLTVLLVSTIAVCTISTFAPIAAYLTERFPAHIRASGYGVGYSLAIIIPAFYAFYLSGLSAFMPSHYAPIPLIVLAGLLISLGGYLGPETKDVDMGAHTHELGRKTP